MFLKADAANLVKFRYCEKATKFEKISKLYLKLLINVKRKVAIFEAFSEYLNCSIQRKPETLQVLSGTLL